VRGGGGGGAAAERRGGAEALGPEPLERRGGLGLPVLGESSDMSGWTYATNQNQTRKALWCRSEQKQSARLGADRRPGELDARFGGLRTARARARGLRGCDWAGSLTARQTSLAARERNCHGRYAVLSRRPWLICRM